MKNRFGAFKIGILFTFIELIFLASLQWRLALLYCLGFTLGMYAYYHIYKTCEMASCLDKRTAVAYVRKQFIKRYVVYGSALFLVGMFSKSGMEIVIFSIGILSIKFYIQLSGVLYYVKDMISVRKKRFDCFFDHEYLGKKREE